MENIIEYMVNYNVDSLTSTQVMNESGIEDETSYSTNTGNPVLLASLTRTEAEWGSLAGWDAVANNAHNIAGLVVSALQTQYAGKIVDLDGIYITLTNV